MWLLAMLFTMKQSTCNPAKTNTMAVISTEEHVAFEGKLAV